MRTFDMRTTKYILRDILIMHSWPSFTKWSLESSSRRLGAQPADGRTLKAQVITVGLGRVLVHIGRVLVQTCLVLVAFCPQQKWVQWKRVGGGG